MLAARVSGPGNGDELWLRGLIKQTNKITSELRSLTSGISRNPYPAENDVKQAYDLASRLLDLIKEQIIPNKQKLSRIAANPGESTRLSRALTGLENSGETALDAIAIYNRTLDNENQRQLNRRSNSSFSADQRTLQKLRREAIAEVSKLLKASEGFVRFISS